MVQTLRNAFKSGRIHHAFILTGVRGVGKTTTARILARAFNYEDETGRHPDARSRAQEGIHCRAIIEGRHVDVVEMDAASNTGINDIREIIDSVKYGPGLGALQGLHHRRSAHALDGGLQRAAEDARRAAALCEVHLRHHRDPQGPGHHPVAAACASTCAASPPEIMTAHLDRPARPEGIDYEPEALAMIVRAGEGSVRDNQSLLDQAISPRRRQGHRRDGQGHARPGRPRPHHRPVRGADGAATSPTRSPPLRELYDAGADPQTIVADLCDFTHLVTRIKVVPAAADDVSLTPDERTRGAELAQKLAMRALTRAWQILFKGYDEVAKAGNALQAAEMVLVRLAYAADLPTPDELIARLSNQPAPQAPAVTAPVPRATAAAAAPQAPAPARAGAAPQLRRPPPRRRRLHVPRPARRAICELIALAGEQRDLIVKLALEASLRPVSFADGRLEVALVEGADPGIIQTLSARLKLWTGRQLDGHRLDPARRRGAHHQANSAEARQRAEPSAAHEDPLVQAILETFPGARVANVIVREARRRCPIEPTRMHPPTNDEDDDE